MGRRPRYGRDRPAALVQYSASCSFAGTTASDSSCRMFSRGTARLFSRLGQRLGFSGAATAGAVDGGGRVRDRTTHFARRLVFAQALVDHLAQQVFGGPGQKRDLGDE